MNDNEKLIAEARAIAPGVALSALDLIPDGEQQHGCIISDGAAIKVGVVSAFRLLYRLADALEAAEKAHTLTDYERDIEYRDIAESDEWKIAIAGASQRDIDAAKRENELQGWEKYRITAAESEPQGEPSDAQYPEVDAFAERMRAELVANAHKGDHWQNMTVREAWGEISWHVGKLTGAIKASEVAAIRELAADIANGALMLDQIIAVNLHLDEIGRAAGGVR